VALEALCCDSAAMQGPHVRVSFWQPTALELGSMDKEGKVFQREQLQTMGEQDSWRARASVLAERPTASEMVVSRLVAADLFGNDTMRDDGSRMAFERYDNVYSNAHVGKDTMSALRSGCVPNVDPRRAMARPKSLAYGTSTVGQPAHMARTTCGPRRVLPSRSFMTCSLAHDF